jgi:hypothetical protein
VLVVHQHQHEVVNLGPQGVVSMSRSDAQRDK